jgi:hypothetical protein
MAGGREIGPNLLPTLQLNEGQYSPKAPPSQASRLSLFLVPSAAPVRLIVLFFFFPLTEC